MHTDSGYFRVLTIAGSDSGGGAGIQADLKTFAALGCYGMSAITTLTAQNTEGVRAIHELPANFVGEQIDAIAEDIGVDAVKIGMLYSAEVIKTVAEKIQEYNLPHVVLDPVMHSKTGANLLQNDAVEALVELLFPICELVTPNIMEASVFAEVTISNQKQMPRICEQIRDLGANAVLIKGGHLKGEQAADCLYAKNEQGEYEVHWVEAKRIDSKNTHGTGCTLASAIASCLAKGMPLDESVTVAKRYLTEAIEAAATKKLGKGQAPVHHFHSLWQ